MPRKLGLTKHRSRQGVQLANCTVSPVTRNRYQRALLFFCSFLAYVSRTPVTSLEYDWCLAQAFQYMFENGWPYSRASDLLSAVVDAYPWMKAQLHTSRRWLAAWRRREPPRRATPLTSEVTIAIAEYFRFNLGLQAGLCILIAFHVFLRPAELFGLLWSDISVTAHSGPAILALRQTKTGSRKFGAIEFVRVDDPVLSAMLFSALSDGAIGPLWRHGRSRFRQLFRQALSALSLDDFGFTPYSLRRGGATFDFNAHRSFDLACERGRWAHVRSARVYLDDAVATLALIRLPPAAVSAVRCYTFSFSSFLLHFSS